MRGLSGPMEKTKIIYDDNGVRTAYVNVSRLTADREEIGLLFGRNISGVSPGAETDVQITNRIILSPYAAKRLSFVLEDNLRSYEFKYGPINTTEHQTPPVPPHASLASYSIPSRPEITDEKAGRLFELIKGLDVQIGIERSFKFFEGSILADRFLLGFKRDDVSGDCNARILDVCTALDMPLEYQESFRSDMSGANIILFGFEGDGESRLYKAYLEFGLRIKQVTPDNLAPFVIHQGYKWDASDNRKCARTDYTCFPLFTIRDIIERVRRLYHPGLGRGATEIAEGFLKAASEKVRCEETLYLEAGENDNPRRSFDLNIYRANLRMGDVFPLMEKICRHFSITEKKFSTFYEPVKSRVFGHLSGGVDRHGRDFMTIYFGVRGSSVIPAMK